MDNNLAQLKVLAEVFNTDKIITSDEIEQVLKGILSIMNSFKKGNEELNAETKQVVGDLLQKTLAEYDAIKESVSQETLQAGVKVATEFDSKIGEIKGLMAEVMAMRPKDGKPADETKIVEEVLSKIKLPEYKETVLDDREKIVQKINTGTKKDSKIEFAQIEGTDKFHKDLLNRAIEILDSRTKFLINKNVKHDATLSGSGTDADPLTVVGGGGGTSNHALLTNLDYASSGHTGFEPAKGADDNYVTDAEKVVIGNTSGTNTGDQVVPDNLTDFTGQTAWRVFYSDSAGDVTELALGADGTFLKSNGASSAPTFATPAGSGDVAKVGTPVNNQVGVWTGDGTLEGDAALTFDTTTDTLATTNVTATLFTGALTGTASGNLVSGGALGTPSSGTLTNATGLPIAGLVASTSTAIGVGSVELGHASDTTIARVSAGVISVEGVTIPSISSTSTLTNKRITQRVVTTTDDATAVIDVDVTDLYELSAVANATTFTLSGTPTDGQKLIVRFKDAGVAKGLTWTGFTAIGITLPTTTVASKWGYVGCVYNSVATQWQAIAYSVEA